MSIPPLQNSTKSLSDGAVLKSPAPVGQVSCNYTQFASSSQSSSSESFLSTCWSSIASAIASVWNYLVNLLCGKGSSNSTSQQTQTSPQATSGQTTESTTGSTSESSGQVWATRVQAMNQLLNTATLGLAPDLEPYRAKFFDDVQTLLYRGKVDDFFAIPDPKIRLRVFRIFLDCYAELEIRLLYAADQLNTPGIVEGQKQQLEARLTKVLQWITAFGQDTAFKSVFSSPQMYARVTLLGTMERSLIKARQEQGAAWNHSWQNVTDLLNFVKTQH